MHNNQLKHIAIIMDGNGRWAKSNNKTRLEGHKKGVSAVKTIIQKSIELKIDCISLYTFSNDNCPRIRDGWCPSIRNYRDYFIRFNYL